MNIQVLILLHSNSNSSSIELILDTKRLLKKKDKTAIDQVMMKRKEKEFELGSKLRVRKDIMDMTMANRSL